MESRDEIGRLGRTLDSIRPSDGAILRNEMSYLYGRDPSILAYSQRPGPSQESKKNLYSDYESEDSIHQDIPSLGSETLASQTVKVYLRLKPFPKKMKLSKEQEEAYQIVNTTTLLTKLPCLDSTTISLQRNSHVQTVCKKFTFTETFGPEVTQLALFERVIQPQMVEFLAGNNGTVMTYGTTNSGKSHTLQGTTSYPGIIPRSLEYVFSNINPKLSPCYKPVHYCDIASLSEIERQHEIEEKAKILASIVSDKHQYISAYKQMQKLLEEESPQRPSQATDAQYLVWVSFAEIYNETIYDLLSNTRQKPRTPLKLAADNHGRAFIKGLKTVCVNSGSEAYQVLMAGQCNLKVAATALNAKSSRSHCIFTITLLKFDHESRPDTVEISRFSFCDLAGSERLKKTLNVGDRLREAQNINTSLLVLGRCLKSIYEGQIMKQPQDHVGPFRESKLTRLFQPALSGREPLALIVNVNPLPNLYEETQNVLNFAAIAKKIIVQPKKVKRRKSVTRFSLVVAQSIKTNTDWEDLELESITEQSSDGDDSVSDLTSLRDYEEMLSENERLKHELAALKTSNMKRDVQIRQEMADMYSAMLAKLEADYKNRMQDFEEQQEDYYEYQSSRLQEYYLEKLNKATNKKRKRSDEDDDEDDGNDDDDEQDDDDRHKIHELELENSRLIAENTTMKDTLKDLRKQKETTESEKNTLKYELGLANEELKNLRAIVSSFEQSIPRGDQSAAMVNQLKSQLSSAAEKKKILSEMLDEAKQEYLDMTEECRKKDEKLIEIERNYIIELEKNSDLTNEIENLNVLHSEQASFVRLLETKLENETTLRRKIQNDYETLKNSLNSAGGSFNSTNAIIKQEIFSPSTRVSADGADNHSQEEILLEIRDIPLESRDKDEMIENLQKELQLLQNEKLILHEKWSQSANEVKSVRSDLDVTKKRLDEITSQLMERHQERLLADDTHKSYQANVDIIFETQNKMKQEPVEFSGENSDTCSPPGVDQVSQTSFSGPSSENKSLQTTLNGTEGLIEAQNQLDDMKVQYGKLKAQYDCEIVRANKLTEELNSVKGNLNAMENAVPEDREQIEKLVRDNQQLAETLAETVKEKEDLVMQIEEFKNVQENLKIQLTDYQQKLSLLEDQVEKQRESEKLQVAKSAEIEQTLSKVLATCEKEHLSQISDLNKQLQSLSESNAANLKNLEEHINTVGELENKIQILNKIEVEISQLNAQLSQCRADKVELETQLSKNLKKISEIESKLEQSKVREKDKEDEIVRLQKEIKSHITKVPCDTTNRETEKEHKKVLQELNETRAELNRTKEMKEKLEIKVEKLEARTENYIQTQKMMETLQKNFEDQKIEIKELKMTNKNILSALNEKDMEMENFKKNRDEMMARYESLVKSTQDELDREKREVSRFQELFRQQAQMPRDRDNIQTKFRAPSDDRVTVKQRELKVKDDNITSDEVSPTSVSSARRPRRGRKAVAVSETPQNENEIPVIELSGSESKRTTRRTAAVAAVPSTEKRATRRKKLFNPEDSLVDVTPDITPSSASTRSMRTRKK